MEYNKLDIIGDFALRTQQNLEIIEDLARNEGKGFEVTQLVNSLLGLLVFPQQGWFAKLPKTSLADLEQQGWPKIKFLTNTVHCQTLDQLVRYLRNAVGHYNVDFLVNDGEIAEVRLWNHENGRRNNPINVEVLMDIEDLRVFMFKFVDELKKLKTP